MKDLIIFIFEIKVNHKSRCDPFDKPNQREVWEPETTLNNLRLIRSAREERGEDTTLMVEIEKELSSTVKR